jgi:hypothetical protein
VAERFVDPRTLQANPGVLRTPVNDARSFFDTASPQRENEGLVRLASALGDIGDTLGQRREEEARHQRAEERQLADNLAKIRGRLEAGGIDPTTAVALDPEQGFPGLYREDAKGRATARTFDETLKQEFQEKNLAGLSRDDFEKHIDMRFRETVEAHRGNSDVFFGALIDDYDKTREELIRQHDGMKRELAREDNLLTFKTQVGTIINDAAYANLSPEETARRINEEIAQSGKLFAVSNADRAAAILASLREDIDDRDGDTSFAEEVAEKLGFDQTPEFQAVVNAAESKSVRDRIDRLTLQDKFDARRERVLSDQAAEFIRKGERVPAELLDELRSLDPFIDERLGNYTRNRQTNAWNDPLNTASRDAAYTMAYSGELTQSGLNRLELEQGIPPDEVKDIRRIIDSREKALNDPIVRSLENSLSNRFRSSVDAGTFGFGTGAFAPQPEEAEALARLQDQLFKAGIEMRDRTSSEFQRWFIERGGEATDSEKLQKRDEIVRDFQLRYDKLEQEQVSLLKEQFKARESDPTASGAFNVPSLRDLPGTGVEPAGAAELTRTQRISKATQESRGGLRIDVMRPAMQDTVLTLWELNANNADPAIRDPLLRPAAPQADVIIGWVSAIRAGEGAPASAARAFEQFEKQFPQLAGKVTLEEFIKATYEVFFAGSRKK